jgi:GT2 family glycosyltransferase
MRALPEVARIVVVDNASEDDTRERLRACHPDILVVALPDNFGAAARNVGVRLAATDYVALCDDDTWWEPGCLARACALLDAYPRVAVVSARVVVEPFGRIDPTSIRMAGSPLDSSGLPGRALLGFLAGACVFRREAFLQAGGFEPRLFLGGEEALVALDLASRGWRMIYAEELLVHHQPSVQRNVRERRHLLARNAIYVAVLRLSPTLATLEIVRALRRAMGEGTVWPVLREVAAARRWLLAERRVVPSAVEALLQTVRSYERSRPFLPSQAVQSRPRNAILFAHRKSLDAGMPEAVRCHDRVNLRPPEGRMRGGWARMH